MRKWRNLVITLVILLALGGTLYYVNTMKPAEDKNKKDTQTDKPKIELLNAKSEEIKEIYIKNKTGEYTIAKIGDKWGIKELQNADLDKTKVENVVYDLANVSADMVVEENAADLGKYGLSLPQAELKVSLVNGTVKQFLIGSQIPVAGGYYFIENGQKKVYALPSFKGESIQKPASEYRNKAILTIDPAKLTYVNITGRDGLVFEVQAKPQGTKEANPVSNWQMLKPYTEVVDSEGLTKLMQSLSPIEVSQFVDDNPTDLGRYDLSTPQYTVTVKDDKTTSTLKLSQKDGMLYAMTEGKSFVFTIDNTKIEGLKTLKPFDLVQKFAHLINIDEINNVTVEGKGQKYTLEIIKNGDKSDYKVNGKVATEDAFKGAYQEVIGLIANDVISGPVGQTTDYTITFNYKNGTALKAEYKDYNERNYAIVRSDKSQYIILKQKLDGMLEKLKAFDAKPNVRP